MGGGSNTLRVRERSMRYESPRLVVVIPRAIFVLLLFGGVGLVAAAILGVAAGRTLNGRRGRGRWPRHLRQTLGDLELEIGVCALQRHSTRLAIELYLRIFNLELQFLQKFTTDGNLRKLDFHRCSEKHRHLAVISYSCYLDLISPSRDTWRYFPLVYYLLLIGQLLSIISSPLEKSAKHSPALTPPSVFQSRSSLRRSVRLRMITR